MRGLLGCLLCIAVLGYIGGGFDTAVRLTGFCCAIIVGVFLTNERRSPEILPYPESPIEGRNFSGRSREDSNVILTEKDSFHTQVEVSPTSK